jgi:hypothetical protein
MIRVGLLTGCVIALMSDYRNSVESWSGRDLEGSGQWLGLEELREKNRTLMMTGVGISVRTRNVTRSRRMIKGVLCHSDLGQQALLWACMNVFVLMWSEGDTGVSAALLIASRNVQEC